MLSLRCKQKLKPPRGLKRLRFRFFPLQQCSLIVTPAVYDQIPLGRHSFGIQLPSCRVLGIQTPFPYQLPLVLNLQHAALGPQPRPTMPTAHSPGLRISLEAEENSFFADFPSRFFDD